MNPQMLPLCSDGGSKITLYFGKAIHYQLKCLGCGQTWVLSHMRLWCLGFWSSQNHHQVVDSMHITIVQKYTYKDNKQTRFKCCVLQHAVYCDVLCTVMCCVL